MKRFCGDDAVGNLSIVRRLGVATRACSHSSNCPNVFELSDAGYFAVVGTDRTDELKAQLPTDAGCAEDVSCFV
jgi:hypothetical protein